MRQLAGSRWLKFSLQARLVDRLDIVPLGIPVIVVRIPLPGIFDIQLRCERPGNVPEVPVDEIVSFCCVVIPVKRFVHGNIIRCIDLIAIQRLFNLLLVKVDGAPVLSSCFPWRKITRSQDSAVRR